MRFCAWHAVGCVKKHILLSILSKRVSLLSVLCFYSSQRCGAGGATLAMGLANAIIPDIPHQLVMILAHVWCTNIVNS